MFIRHLSPVMLAFAAPLPLAAADMTATPSANLGSSNGTSASAPRTGHSWELPAITVVGQGNGNPLDSDLVGTYSQPRWSTIRQWAEVRSYVIPEGQIEFEYWLTVQQPSRQEKRDAADAGQAPPKPAVVQMYEAEMGLGHRVQLDLYQVYQKDGSNGQNQLDATKFELRYAFADWGKLLGNPTAYAEWTQAANGPDKIEVKLLTCGDIGPRWHWGNNLVWEEQTGDLRETSHEFNTAVSYSLIDGVLSLGGENAIAYVTSKQVDPTTGDTTSGHDHHWEMGIGPSLRFYPIHPMHVILTALVGLNKDAPETKTTLIAGWEF